MSNLGNPMSASWGIPPKPPNLEEEAIEVDDEDVTDEDENELILDEVEPRMMDPPVPEPNREPPAPPTLMPSIIFFIMSSISRDIPPPSDGMPREGIPAPPRDGIPAPPSDDVTMDDDDDDELEKDIDDLVAPSGDSVVAAISCDADDESCFTAVLPSSVV